MSRPGAAAGLLLTLVLFACDGGGATLPPAPDAATAASPRQSEVDRAAAKAASADPAPVPPAYAGRSMPEPTGVDAAGLFASTCAPCHGLTGHGDGPAAVGLHPKPAAFAAPGFLAHRSDAYLFWRISEGKRATPMPAFKYQLSEAERWALVRYLRETWETDGP